MAPSPCVVHGDGGWPLVKSLVGSCFDLPSVLTIGDLICSKHVDQCSLEPTRKVLSETVELFKQKRLQLHLSGMTIFLTLWYLPPPTHEYVLRVYACYVHCIHGFSTSGVRLLHG